MYRALTRPAFALGSALLIGCTAPGISAGITQSQALLAQTQTALEPAFKVRIVSELRAAELEAARNGRQLVALDECFRVRQAELAYDMRQCSVMTFFDPLKTSSEPNAAQVSAILGIMSDYFAALDTLNKTDSVTELRTLSEGLVKSFNELGASPNQDLSGLGQRGADALGSLPALAEFIADQARIGALRDAMDAADPVLDDFVVAATPVLSELGDPLTAARNRLADAELDYLTAFTGGASPARQVDLAEAVRKADADLRKAEERSPIRRLYLIRATHAEMLETLENGGSLDELNRLVDQLTELRTALET